MRKLILLFVFTTIQAFSTPIHHDLVVTLSPDKSYIHVSDQITIDESQIAKTLEFKLHHALILDKNKNIKKIKTNVQSIDVGMDKDDTDKESDLKLNVYQIKAPKKHKGDFKIAISYHGKIESEVTQSAENYARGFSESPGIIWQKGVYLAGSTYWIPYFNQGLLTFKLTTTLPKDWKVVTVGKRVVDKVSDNTHTDTWLSETPQEEIFLIAAAFNEYSYSMGSVQAMAFLRTPDEGLANKYLETTAQYMEMYRKLIGPFPYTKFALVENFWETGYGMPSFTLLGEKIIRFPFILHSSYPHELLHNWWGNSVYVDFNNGNWCEGLTAYMADHLIKEQRNNGEQYRRSTLQKYSNYVNKGNDFPIKKFLSRYDAASEAIGYGKVMMVNHMLRRKVGDDKFIKAYQTFNRNNKFKRASFDDIKQAFEGVISEDLGWFFEQWINRTAAPSLALREVKEENIRGKTMLSFSLQQLQDEDVFYLDVPVAIVTDQGINYQTVEMNSKQQQFALTVSGKVLKILIDPHFDLFRKLDPRESPPTFTKAYGSSKTLIVLPGNSNQRYQQYLDFANKWVAGNQDKFEIVSQSDLSELPNDKAVMILGLENKYTSVFNQAIEHYNANLSAEKVQFDKQQLNTTNSSFFAAAANPNNPNQVITVLSIGNEKAIDGLVRKLPHYGKYSYLAFDGEEPSNSAKGQWPVNSSPLIHQFGQENILVELEKRKALAYLAPAFSADRMMETVEYLANDELKGRGIGTSELDKSADYIANKFKDYGLRTGSDNDSYFQKWQQDVLGKKNVNLTNVVGVIPGTNPELSQAVVISAHYDHLGEGWPNTKKDNKGKIHNGADDNASGVAVMLEIAKALGKSKPERSIIFVAFTAEEAGLIGSRYFVENYKKHPFFANINIDTVGRLNNNKLMVLNTDTAREWKFIFMGTDYTTGVLTQLITQELDASDQVSFIAKGVPAVQLFYAGVESDYHVPEDVSEKIDSAGLIKVAAVVREITEYLAQRTDPMPFTGKNSSVKAQAKIQTKATKRAATGSMPDFAFSGVGVRIAGISKGSAADKAGIKEGDVIIRFDGAEVTNLKDYSQLLKQHQPNDAVDMLITRNGKEIKVRITLGER